MLTKSINFLFVPVCPHRYIVSTVVYLVVGFMVQHTQYSFKQDAIYHRIIIHFERRRRHIHSKKLLLKNNKEKAKKTNVIEFRNVSPGSLFGVQIHFHHSHSIYSAVVGFLCVYFSKFYCRENLFLFRDSERRYVRSAALLPYYATF